MIDRIAQVVLLVEDRRAGDLLRRYLKRFGIDWRTIRLVIATSKGSAFTWVINQYPVEVHEYRSRIARGRNLAALIVHVDADNKAVASRRDELENSLRSAGAAVRTPTERIAVCIPKRNIETWIHGLCGETVDEVYDFKEDKEHRIGGGDRQRHRICEQRLGPAADKLYEWTRPNSQPPPEHLPSLTTTIAELRRLER